MIEISVAGAGAGKTHGLAKTIIKDLCNETHKKIFALTYTNAAKAEIEQEIVKHFGMLPSLVEVATVHTFLLNEIIYPFSPFVLGELYSTSSTVILNPDYKAREIKIYKNMGIMHVDEVYAAAKRVIDKNMSQHKSKKQKAKIDRVIKIISTGIEKIFIDEVQDLDSTALRVFEVLGLESVDIYMVGDPKQAIRFTDSYNDFIKKHQQDANPNVTILPFNNVTRRVPVEILNISNAFCYSDQKQTSVSKKFGTTRFIESTHPQFNEILDGYIKSDSIVCIDKKSGKYSTKKNLQCSFHPDVESLVRKSCLNRDPDIFLEASQIKFNKNVSSLGARRAITAFLEDYGIQYTGKIYAQMMQAAVDESKATYHVSSIDAIKGLEADMCILILTPNTYKYLTQSNLNSEQEFNKEWKKIYVALTRPRKEFIVALDHDLFVSGNLSVEDVRNGLLGMGFSAI